MGHALYIKQIDIEGDTEKDEYILLDSDEVNVKMRMPKK